MEVVQALEPVQALEQLELFVADIIDVAVKGDTQSMESPIFALSTRTDKEKWVYQYRDFRLEVVPSMHGRPTIFDKDLLMYCISQIMEAENRGNKISRRVRFTAHQFLLATGRGTAGKDYDAMFAAIERLRGVTLSFKGGDKDTPNRPGEVDGLIDSAKITQTRSRTDLEVTLSEWVYSAIERKHVLTYHADYYKLRKPNERRLYELCRKFCGIQPMWEIGLEKLYQRFGTRMSFRDWKIALKKLLHLRSIPEYDVNLDLGREMLIVYYSPKGKDLSSPAVY